MSLSAKEGALGLKPLPEGALPIPIQVNQRHLDSVLSPEIGCPQIKEREARLKGSQRYKELEKESKKWAKEFSEYGARDLHGVLKMRDIVDQRRASGRGLGKIDEAMYQEYSRYY